MQYAVISNEIKTSLSPSECYLYMVLQTFKYGEKAIVNLQDLAKRAGYEYDTVKTMLCDMYKKLDNTNLIDRKRTKFDSVNRKNNDGWCEWHYPKLKSNFTIVPFDIILHKELNPGAKHFYFVFKSILGNGHNDIKINKKTMSLTMNLDLRTINKYLKVLIEKQIITSEVKNNYEFTYEKALKESTIDKDIEKEISKVDLMEETIYENEINLSRQQVQNNRFKQASGSNYVPWSYDF